MTETEGLQRAGQVKIEQLKLISTGNDVIDLTEFLVELNLYEDVFSNYLRGEIVLTDSRNLIDKFYIHGEEFLNLKIRTPTFKEEDSIQKTFRVYKVSNREIVRDTNTQNYTLHFVSVEVFYDLLLPLFVPFEGIVSDVAGNVFSDFLAASRNFDVSENSREINENPDPTNLIILSEAANKVKFVSPGWSPLKCINWLASKAIPASGKSKNFLFFESNKNFYFGSLENLFKNAVERSNYLGTYTVSVSNVRDKQGTQDVNREMFLAKDVEMTESVDYIKNYTSGYLANRLVYLDVFNKEYEIIDYDHVSQYENYFHTSGTGNKSIPVFTKDSVRNFATNISFYPKNPKLFTGFTDNINEKMGEIHGNRLSSLLELTNVKMNITVPGRTDAEIGRLIYFSYPALGAHDESEKSTDVQDKLYSGYYFITAIRHKINKNEHMMVMEIVKDSLYVDTDSTERVN